MGLSHSPDQPRMPEGKRRTLEHLTQVLAENPSSPEIFSVLEEQLTRRGGNLSRMREIDGFVRSAARAAGISSGDLADAVPRSRRELFAFVQSVNAAIRRPTSAPAVAPSVPLRIEVPVTPQPFIRTRYDSAQRVMVRELVDPLENRISVVSVTSQEQYRADAYARRAAVDLDHASEVARHREVLSHKHDRIYWKSRQDRAANGTDIFLSRIAPPAIIPALLRPRVVSPRAARPVESRVQENLSPIDRRIKELEDRIKELHTRINRKP